jgi:hypothetical protein
MSGNQSIGKIFQVIRQLLTAQKVKNVKYERKKTDSKIINAANCETYNSRSLDIE